MARVKIKCSNSKDPRKTVKLLEILATNNTVVSGIIPISDGFIILTTNDNELDNIFNNKTDRTLEEQEFIPQIPPQLRANRSVLIFKVDNHIFNNETESIKEEIITKNEWVGNINQVHKFPINNTLKITFDEPSKAQKAQETGLKLFSMRLPKQDIKQETFYSIITCKKSTSYKICSECSEEGHIWKECSYNIKKCITCNGDHGTLAMRCPKRKEIINNKKKQDRDSQTESYNTVAKKNIGTRQTDIAAQAIASTNSIKPDIHTKIFTCIMHAHVVNIANPGSYEEELKKMLKMNNLITIKAPSNPPSAKILNINLEAETTETLEEEDEGEIIKKEAHTRNNKENIYRQEETRHEQIKAKEIGLTIYT